MKTTDKRIEKESTIDMLIKKMQKYSYLETVVIVTIFLLVGYSTTPNDICLIQQKIPYLIFLLSVLTLFHGFESGFIAMGILSGAMWLFYQKFPYIDFLILLMMILIFSEFHHYWTKKIRELKIGNDYKASKLNELSKAFYSLKISHDQLEKNYVVKPMSIRNAIEQIVKVNKQIDIDDINAINSERYKNFMSLLQKSFNMQSVLIIHKLNQIHDKSISLQNSIITHSSNHTDYDEAEIFDEYLIAKAIDYKKPIYISDEAGNPAFKEHQNSKFLAAIPSIYNNELVAILAIEAMPFMAFNKENLTSISILLEYITVEIYKNNILNELDSFTILKDDNFRYEYNKLDYLYRKYKVNSTILVLKIDNEIQEIKIYEMVQKLLRSLDIVTCVKNKDVYYLVLLFPLNDKSAAMGFLNRLLYNIKNKNDKIFEYMTFDIKRNDLVEKYIADDYHG